MGERVKFFNLSDDKLYYDERKKRFVFLEDAPEVVYKEVNNSHFKEVRLQFSICAAKTRSLRARTCRIQIQTEVWAITAQAHELSNKARDEETLENHGVHVLQLLLCKYKNA